MLDSNRFWICVGFLLLGACQGKDIKSGDKIYLENNSCTLHRGYIKCDTFPINKCSTQKDDWTPLTIFKEKGGDIKNGDHVTLQFSKGKWLDCNHTDSKCAIEKVHDGDTGSNEWTSSKQQHFTIRNKRNYGHIKDKSKVFFEYEWDDGTCLRPSENLIFGNSLRTDKCNENMFTGICDPWHITLDEPTPKPTKSMLD